MAPSPQPTGTEARLAALEDALRNLGNKTLYAANIGAGGITIDGAGGISVSNGHPWQFFIGAGSTAPNHGDGSQQVVTIIGDEAGRDRIVMWDPTNPSNTLNQQLYEYDSKGNQVRTQDQNGGWATPWFSIPLYPLFTPPQSATPANGTVYGYATIATAATGIAQGQLLWEGRIPWVSHPRIMVDGVWGQASGTVAPTYTLKVGGSTVGTFTPAFGTGQQGPYDISTLIGQTAVDVSLSVTWTGTGVIAAGVLGCYLRQT